MLSKKQKRGALKALVHLAIALPALWLALNWYYALNYMPHELGFNPQETTHHTTGDWALRILLASLLVSPLARIKKLRSLMQFRRMVGLWAYSYVVLHIISYVWLAKYLDIGEIVADIIKRPYITIGMLAFLMLTPLAVTSTKGWIKRLGAKTWQKIHYMIYGVALLGPLHFIMMRKGIQMEPRIYMWIAVALLLLRFIKKRRAA